MGAIPAGSLPVPPLLCCWQLRWLILFIWQFFDCISCCLFVSSLCFVEVRFNALPFTVIYVKTRTFCIQMGRQRQRLLSYGSQYPDWGQSAVVSYCSLGSENFKCSPASGNYHQVVLLVIWLHWKLNTFSTLIAMGYRFVGGSIGSSWAGDRVLSEGRNSHCTPSTPYRDLLFVTLSS